VIELAMIKVFVDDSGWQEYLTPYSKDFINSPPQFNGYEEFWRKNYFVLCGVCVNTKNIPTINLEINRLKLRYFETTRIEVKSDWLRNPNKRRKMYLEPFKLSTDALNSFGEEYVNLISTHSKSLKIISVIFDKRCYSEQKRLKADGSPLLKCSQVLFERIQYLNSQNTQVTFDQMDSSLRTSVGKNGQILKVLQNQHALETIHVEDYSNISSIGFKESSRENFLQVADICAYDIYRQFVEFGRSFGQQSKLFSDQYLYFERISSNLLDNSGRVKGVSLVVLPDINKKTSPK
jgi:hypothetical protein